MAGFSYRKSTNTPKNKASETARHDAAARKAERVKKKNAEQEAKRRKRGK